VLPLLLLDAARWSASAFAAVPDSGYTVTIKPGITDH
jgi:hypothetical protein